MKRFGRVPIRSTWFRAWVSVAAVGLVAATAVWTMPGVAPPSGTPSATSGSSAGPSGTSPATATPASADPGTWQPLALEPYVAVAAMVPLRSDTAGVEPGTTFRLTSRTSIPATELASRLEVSPAIALSVARGASDAEAIVRPASALTPGASYRFRIRTDAGAVAASWAFKAKQPLHVVASIPRDQATGVPTRTGIEATFDQDDPVGYTGKVAISPAIPFELEIEGRTIALVPQKELAERTVYTVTIAKGIGVRGSDVTLEKDVVIRFETGARETSAGTRVTLRDLFAETSPVETPAVGISIDCQQDGGAVDQEVRVHRFPDVDHAVAAARQLLAAPSWALWSDSGLVATTGLPVALRITAHLETRCGRTGDYIAFPSPLPPGAYLVVLPGPGRDAQMILQVARLALYTSVSGTRSVAWVNDTVTGRPVDGASVGGVAGPAYGRTDANGLLVWKTPPALAASVDGSAAPIVAVRKGDAATFSVLGSPGWSAYPSGLGVSASYWLALQTDRSVFRTTDMIRAWGVLRPRAGGVARDVEIRLLSDSATLSATAPAIARAPAAPDAAGMFAASLPIAGLPLGGYQVALVVAGQVVASSWIRVDEIRKPAYRIDVTLDRHVLVAGDTFTATARAAYFDGTPVPGLQLTFEHGPKTTAVTDATGTAKVRLKAYQGNSTYPTDTPVSVTPVRPEEGTIEGMALTRVYPAAIWPTVSAGLAGAELSVSGRLQALDLNALERAFKASDPLVEGGATIRDASVDVSVVQIVQHQRQVGTTYDWISKRTVPLYETWTEKVTLDSTSRATDADGRFAMTVTVPDPRGQYEVQVWARDRAGRRALAETAVDGVAAAARPDSWPYLSVAGTGTHSGCCQTYAVGDQISLRVERPVEAQVPGAARFLFTVAQRGIREAIVRSTATFDRPFLATDIPSVSIDAVQFTGRGYVMMGGMDAAVRLATEQIKVDVRTDAASYRPGADARLQIRTTGPNGKPTAASVVVQAVDEKLYAIDAAYPVDLLPALYASLPTGIAWRAATHAPRTFGDTTTGGGDTYGGGPRMDFRDTLLFRRVSTDAAGRASVSFRLSDDLTSWRVTVAAVDAKLHAGTGTVEVRVGLPFFAEATIAPEYLVSDRPVLRLGAYGSSLRASDGVTFRISAPTLGLAPTTVAAKAFVTTTLALPRLTPGIHRIEIAATTIGGSPALKDSLIRTVRVVPSRYQEQTTLAAPLDAAFRAAGGEGLTTYIISDAGRATLAAILEPLLWGDGARVDQALGATVARDVLVGTFGRDPATLPETRFESSAYQQWDGITLLPYSSPDLALTTAVALAAPERFDRPSLANALSASYGDPHSTMTRERGIVALAGLAALGEPVAGELGLFARQPDLTVRERLYLALAYAEVGDETAARTIERSVLGTYGRAMGPWVRLDVSPSRDEVVEATGLLAVLAAAIGDPIADRAQAYVEANPPKKTLQTLEELAFVRHSLDRLDRATARFAWTVDGIRNVVDLASTGSFALTLTAAQRVSLRLERLAGDMTVTTSWSTRARPGGRPADPDVRIVRTVSPGLTVGQTEMVRVKLTVTLAPTATDKCYEITERVPSGLAPLPVPDQNGAAGVDERTTAVFWPDAVAGQIVSFCVSRAKPTVVAIYSARVVSPGTYTWEPATIAASVGTERVSLTETSTLTIR